MWRVTSLSFLLLMYGVEGAAGGAKCCYCWECCDVGLGGDHDRPYFFSCWVDSGDVARGISGGYCCCCCC